MIFYLVEEVFAGARVPVKRTMKVMAIKIWQEG